MVWKHRRSAIENVYREHRQGLFTVALSITKCPAQAEDAIQDAFHRLFIRNVITKDLKAYVFRSVRNAAVDQVRAAGRNAEWNDGYIFDTAKPTGDVAAGLEMERIVAQELMALDDNERETVIQHIWGGLTFREIAAVRQSPQGTVATWYRRGLEKLRIKMKAYAIERSRENFKEPCA